MDETGGGNSNGHIMFNSENNYELNSKLSLKQQVMINQFKSVTGCNHEQSLNLLASTNWQYQMALSLFFDDYAILSPAMLQQQQQQQQHLQLQATSKSHHININRPLSQSNSNSSSSNNLFCLNSLSFCAPSNTPVTPPNLDYLEKAFSKLSAPHQPVVTSSAFSSNSGTTNNNQFLLNSISSPSNMSKQTSPPSTSSKYSYQH